MWLNFVGRAVAALYSNLAQLFTGFGLKGLLGPFKPKQIALLYFHISLTMLCKPLPSSSPKWAKRMETSNLCVWATTPTFVLVVPKAVRCVWESGFGTQLVKAWVYWGSHVSCTWLTLVHCAIGQAERHRDRCTCQPECSNCVASGGTEPEQTWEKWYNEC